MRYAASLTLVLLLAGCQAQKAEEAAEAGDAASSDVAAAAPAIAAGGERTAPAARPVLPLLPKLAYLYSYQIEAPAEGAKTLMRQHQQACVSAGPATCQVVGAQINALGEKEVSGRLSLRATNDWVGKFRDGLEGQAKAADGKIRGEKVETEELSRQIIDADAQVRALTVMRDRLQDQLARHNGKLGELLDAERELARVQGELDALRANAEEMRGRVAMSAVDITYASKGALAPDGTFAPLGSAVRNVVQLSVLALAGLIQVVAFLAPWALLGGAGWWAIRRRARRAKPAAPAPAQP